MNQDQTLAVMVMIQLVLDDPKGVGRDAMDAIRRFLKPFPNITNVVERNLIEDDGFGFRMHLDPNTPIDLASLYLREAGK